jgi:hypothetical protein
MRRRVPTMAVGAGVMGAIKSNTRAIGNFAGAVLFRRNGRFQKVMLKVRLCEE